MTYIKRNDPNCLIEPNLTHQFLINMIVYQYFVKHPEEIDLYIADNFYSPIFTIDNITNSTYVIDDDVNITVMFNEVSHRPPLIHQIDHHPTLKNLIHQKLSVLDNDSITCTSIPTGWYPPIQLDDLNTDNSHTLSHVTIGKSLTKDYYGNNYYFFVNNPNTDGVSRYMLSSSSWEQSLNFMFRHLWLTEGSGLNLPVLDVGVNYGSFLLFAASLGCRLYGFEMQSYLFALVEMSLRINGYRNHVNIFNTAVWEESGLEFSFTPVFMNYGATSVQEKNTGEFKVMSRRIDELFTEEKIFFMKIDIEGSEPQALKGMDDYINNKKVKHIVMEVRYPEILEKLYNIGYICRIFDEFPECKWPHLNSTCTLQSYNDAILTFQTRPMDEHGYIDIHCALPDHLFY